MSQNLSADLKVDPALMEGEAQTPSELGPAAEPTHLLASSPGAMVNNHANAVMDELFQDLDQALAGKTQLKQEPPAQPPAGIAQLAPRSPLSDTPATLEETTAPASLQPAASTDLSQPASPTQTAAVRKVALIERLLVVAACLSVAAVGAAWLVLNQMRLQSEQASAPIATATGNLQAPLDQGFVDYVKRSLDAIDRRTETQRQVASVSGAGASRGLPSVSVPASPGAPQVMERVYVPLYQPPAIASGSSVPSVGTMPLPPLAPAAPNPPNIAATGTHVLVGVLELGDRSAALFEVNGTTQRINIGERIGTSGWSLVSVSNQEAIVRRNGEVRSVFIGQQF